MAGTSRRLLPSRPRVGRDTGEALPALDGGSIIAGCGAGVGSSPLLVPGVILQFQRSDSDEQYIMSRTATTLLLSRPCVGIDAEEALPALRFHMYRLRILKNSTDSFFRYKSV